jgi:hypothetical protein
MQLPETLIIKKTHEIWDKYQHLQLEESVIFKLIRDSIICGYEIKDAAHKESLVKSLQNVMNDYFKDQLKLAEDLKKDAYEDNSNFKMYNLSKSDQELENFERSEK